MDKVNCTVTQQSQVSREMATYCELVDVLHREIVVLTEKLEPVLRCSDTDKAGGDGCLVPSLVHLADRLRTRNDQLSEAIDAIRNLSERSEVYE